ncbi:hypothetical protein CsSME_00018994 [Camellia sinensis var. sinensis]
MKTVALLFEFERRRIFRVVIHGTISISLYAATQFHSSSFNFSTSPLIIIIHLRMRLQFRPTKEEEKKKKKNQRVCVGGLRSSQEQSLLGMPSRVGWVTNFPFTEAMSFTPSTA